MLLPLVAPPLAHPHVRVVLVLVLLVGGGGRRRGRHRHVRRRLQLPQVLEDLGLDLLEVLGDVEVLHARGRVVQLVVRPIVLVVVVVREVVRDLLIQHHGRLVRPAARHVADRVAAAAQDERGHLLLQHKAHALGVPPDGQVEAAEPVAAERVGAALQHDSAGLVHLHDLPDHGLEDGGVRGVVDAVLERKVDRVVLPRVCSDVLDVARAGKVLAKLVKGDGQHAVCRVKGLLDAVAVVDVNVNVEHAAVVLEQLEDGKHDVVRVAEARGLGLFRVVQPARPVNRNVRRALVELDGAADRAARAGLAKLVEALEDGAVLADVESLHLLGVLAHVVWRDVPQEAHVLVGVELAQLIEGGRARPVDLHLLVEAIVEQQVVSHANTMRLHGMALAIVVVANVRVVEVAHPLLAARARHHACAPASAPQSAQ
mmetsp:Transcript_21755/g.64501  ORF Transcript_21755/g.64501 Transcript_21755/m.64501 type:complete len:428 (+) Transcript_21755:163-1446(+)